MNDLLADAWHTLVPRDDDPHGPLPPLLVTLSVVTGLVDAFSYLTLGHVFVANMTGNIVFVGFALAGAPGFSLSSSLVALGAFGIGSLLGGRLGVAYVAQRGRLLSTATAVQCGLVGLAVVVRLVAGSHEATAWHYVLIVLLASMMGLQNAVVRKLAVPELTTTVLTMTTTGIFADSKLAGGPGSRLGRRSVSILAMFLGALLGAVFVLHANASLALVAALLLLLGAGSASVLITRARPDWIGSEA